jgi:transketolase
LIAPADHLQASAAVRLTYDLPGPIYYRIGKREDYVLSGLEGRFRLGCAEVIREGADILIATLGSISAEVVKAADKLAENGVETTICVVSSLRPAPCEDLSELLKRFPVALTVEEHYADGGLGSLVCEVAAEDRVNCRIVRCGVRSLPSCVCGSEGSLREANGLSGDGIFKTALQAFRESKP